MIEKSKNNKIAINSFVKRQTEYSQFTHYKGSWETLANITEEQLEKNNFSKGYREGVILVHMDEKECNSFFTYNNFPIFEGMKLEAVCEKVKGREHEPPKILTKILEPKKQCNYVDIILYSHDVLAENKEQSSDSPWEIISVNGRLDKNPYPMDPLTIVRNYLELPGGTAMVGASPEEVLNMLCDAILHKNGIKNKK